jgi:hypothetical protein
MVPMLILLDHPEVGFGVAADDGLAVPVDKVFNADAAFWALSVAF